MIGARLLFITWLTKNTFSKRTPFLLLYSLFTIPNNYLLPAKRKVSYMSGKLSMSVLYWIFSNHLHSYCIHWKRRGMQQCHVFLNCCHIEKMTIEPMSRMHLILRSTSQVYSDSVISVFSYISQLRLFLWSSCINWLILHITILCYWIKVYIIRWISPIW